ADAERSVFSAKLGSTPIVLAAVVDASQGAFFTETGFVQANDFGITGPNSFGDFLRRIHDIDGDGMPEVGVSTVGENIGGTSIGLLALSAASIQGSPAAVHLQQLVRWNAPPSSAGFGFSFASVGNLVGDSNLDLAVGAPFEGAGLAF